MFSRLFKTSLLVGSIGGMLFCVPALAAAPSAPSIHKKGATVSGSTLKKVKRPSNVKGNPAFAAYCLKECAKLKACKSFILPGGKANTCLVMSSKKMKSAAKYKGWEVYLAPSSSTKSSATKSERSTTTKKKASKRSGRGGR